ncbi:phenol hydroxylase subunit [Paraburkholderia unamae]|uniref:Phenol 2-monooxygenase P0 subunit n=1 Tax=Paraburkholderia unamae TaxID=219649 RepID=A0ABX5KWE4_9BURK|nr:phenol hydroxylase subunit [Paraburkholderia unamae]PVX85163.1 phenol 2-monooxygenase P0 subunit [Paraburkholderia unamae]RAR65747.1 phenol 2-monooxygenase P0 subunit [Paraburkholderia unamae]CAG9252758.1 Phenol hydroxylase [Paraburkholderia unamae]
MSKPQSLVTALERPFDVARRYVRTKAHRADGFVEFEFSIGDPRICVELVMRESDYRAFCATHDVVRLSAVEAAALDAEELKWRYGQPGLAE